MPTDKNGYRTVDGALHPEWWDTTGRAIHHTEMCACGHQRRQHLYATTLHPCNAVVVEECACQEFSPVVPAEPARVALPHGHPWTDNELARTCASCGHRYGVHTVTGSKCLDFQFAQPAFDCDCTGYLDPLAIKLVSETASHRLGECQTCGHLPQKHWQDPEGCTWTSATGPVVGWCDCKKYVFPEGAHDAHPAH